MERRGGMQQVPEFPAGLDWLNAPPLKLSRELRGKVVLLDFWTLCWYACGTSARLRPGPALLADQRGCTAQPK